MTLRMVTLLISISFLSCSANQSDSKSENKTPEPVSDKIELTKTSLEGNMTIKSTEISLWGIYIGMTEAKMMKILNSKPNVKTTSQEMPNEEVLINVIDKNNINNYDLFAVVIRDKKVSEFTLLSGIDDELFGFNKFLIAWDFISSSAGELYTSFLGEPDSTDEVEDESSEIIEDKKWFTSRGFFISVKTDEYGSSKCAFTFLQPK